MQIPPSSPLARILKARVANHANPTESQPPQNAGTPTPNVTEIPYRLKRLEPVKPVEVINDGPFFDTLDAATILGVNPSRLEKRRQRDQGPTYLLYVGDYPRYELSALIEYKAAHRVRPSRQPRPGRRS